MIFAHDLFHSSWGGGDRRRMFTLNCTKRATTEPERAMLLRYMTAHSPGGYQWDSGAGAYWPTMRETAGARRRRHLAQVDTVHDALFPECAAGAARPVRWREPRPRD